MPTTTIFPHPHYTKLGVQTQQSAAVHRMTTPTGRLGGPPASPHCLRKYVPELHKIPSLRGSLANSFSTSFISSEPSEASTLERSPGGTFPVSGQGVCFRGIRADQREEAAGSVWINKVRPLWATDRHSESSQEAAGSDPDWWQAAAHGLRYFPNTGLQGSPGNCWSPRGHLQTCGRKLT